MSFGFSFNVLSTSVPVVGQNPKTLFAKTVDRKTGRLQADRTQFAIRLPLAC